MSCLAESGLLNRCELVRRSATLEELMSCHSHQHVHLYGVSPLLRGTGGLAVNRLPCGGWGVDNDTIWNDIHTPSAAKVAAGSIIELVSKGGDLQLQSDSGDNIFTLLQSGPAVSVTGLVWCGLRDITLSTASRSASASSTTSLWRPNSTGDFSTRESSSSTG